MCRFGFHFSIFLVDLGSTLAPFWLHVGRVGHTFVRFGFHLGTLLVDFDSILARCCCTSVLVRTIIRKASAENQRHHRRRRSFQLQIHVPAILWQLYWLFALSGTLLFLLPGTPPLFADPDLKHRVFVLLVHAGANLSDLNRLFAEPKTHQKSDPCKTSQNLKKLNHGRPRARF